jgi:hypothetical protein
MATFRKTGFLLAQAGALEGPSGSAAGGRCPKAKRPQVLRRSRDSPHTDQAPGRAKHSSARTIPRLARKAANVFRARSRPWSWIEHTIIGDPSPSLAAEETSDAWSFALDTARPHRSRLTMDCGHVMVVASQGASWPMPFREASCSSGLKQRARGPTERAHPPFIMAFIRP